MRIGTISAMTLCLVTSAIAASADQHGRPTTAHAITSHASAQTPQRGSHGPTTTTTTTSGRHATTPTTTTTSTTPTTTTTTPTPILNPIAAKISAHPQQAARIQRMLPSGTTLDTASRGFRNQGQFIAALHVSRNLNIPFADLKSRMTGPNAMSLGQAIHALRPSANATVEARHAHHQTTTDLR